MPSSIAIVLNSLAIPPACSIFSRTNLPTSSRCTCPGTNCVKEFATAIIGFPKSDSFTPVARHRARAPAMFLPVKLFFDLYSGIMLKFPINITTAWSQGQVLEFQEF